VKAAVCREPGGPEVLSYEEVPDPAPGSGEVLIRVEAIAIEGGDLLGRQRSPLALSPHVLGYSSAGTVVAVADDVTDLRPGDRVSAFGADGSHAELRVVRAEHCWVLSDGVDVAAAACIPVAFGTAYEALFEVGDVTAGTNVLLQGAAGAVSLAAVQLAAKAGARVIGTVSNAAQHDAALRYGLHEGINRNDDVAARVLELTDGIGVDLAVDPIGGSAADDVVRATREGGTIVLVGVAARAPTMIDGLALIVGERTVTGFMLSKRMHLPRVRAYVSDLFRRLAVHDLEVVIDRTFPLADAAEAHHYAEQRGRVGRVVMVP
jgi:NADPH2:quinone reductase